MMNESDVFDSTCQAFFKLILEAFRSNENSTVSVGESQDCPRTNAKIHLTVISYVISALILLCYVLINFNFIQRRLDIRPRPLVPIDFIGLHNCQISHVIAFYISTAYIFELMYPYIIDDTSGDETCSDIPLIVKTIGVGFICFPFFAVGSSETTFGFIISILYGVTIFSCDMYFEFVVSGEDHRYRWYHPVYTKNILLIVFILNSIFSLYRRRCNGINASEDMKRNEMKMVMDYVKHVLRPKKPKSNSHCEPEVRPTTRFIWSLEVSIVLLVSVFVVFIGFTINVKQTLKKLQRRSLDFPISFHNLTELTTSVDTCITTINTTHSGESGAVMECLFIAVMKCGKYNLILLFLVIQYVLDFWIVAVCLAFVASFSHFLLINRNYVRNLRMAYKGQFPYIRHPSTMSGSRAVGNFACFTGYNVTYLLIGYFEFCVFFFLLTFVLWDIWMIFNLFHMGSVLSDVIPWWWIAFFSVLILSRFLLTRFVFVHDKRYISIDNRKAFLFWSYFTYFTDIPLGCLSFIMRTVINFLLNVYFFGRIDVAILPKSFETYDNGYNVYSGFVLTEAALSHPILRAFVDLSLEMQTSWMKKLFEVGVSESLQVLTSSSDTDLSTNRRPKMSRELRIRKWQLLYTLVRNPSLVKDRKHNVRSQRLNRVV